MRPCLLLKGRSRRSRRKCQHHQHIIVVIGDAWAAPNVEEGDTHVKEGMCREEDAAHWGPHGRYVHLPLDLVQDLWVGRLGCWSKMLPPCPAML